MRQAGISILAAAIFRAWAVGAWAQAPATASRPALAGAGTAATRPAMRNEGAATSGPATDWDPSFPDLVHLVKTARRAMRAGLQGGAADSKAYVPPDLAGQAGVVYLAARKSGRVVVEVETPEMPVVEAAAWAGSKLAQRLGRKKDGVERFGDGLGLEFEWIGPAEMLQEKYDAQSKWSEGLLRAFEPAAEGIGVEFRNRRGWTRPGAVVSLNYTPDMALQHAESAIDLVQADKLRFAREICYYRFPARHLWQPDGLALPVLLVRGDRLISQDAVGPAVMSGAIGRIADYVGYRQNSSGWFSNSYLPSGDRYDEGNSALVQMHALADWAWYVGRFGGESEKEAVRRGLARSIQYLRPVAVEQAMADGKKKPVEAGLVLMFEGHGDYLESSALLLSAILSAGGDEFGKERDGLIESLIASQNSDGEFEMVVNEAEKSVRPSAGGWAAVALAQAEAIRAEPRIEGALARGLSYYRGEVSASGDPELAASLAIAYSLVYVQSKDARVSDFVFGVLDRFEGLQVDSGNCPWPELWGAINLRARGDVGADTGLYLSALAEGLGLARRIGDEGRVERYSEAIRSAARFVMQLEVRVDGAYYIRSPRDGLGGIRAAPWDNQLRIDHSAAGLRGLCRARAALFPREE